jgi:excisionase family DNA binding protein
MHQNPQNLRSIDNVRASRTWLSANQAAEYLGVSVSFLEKARARGTGPEFVKLGARVLYDVVDVDRWLDSRKRSHR